MFGLQKQRRNAAGSGAWFIAGHLTVFAKLSHHAVPLESRIFSSRCFSFSVPPLPSPPPFPLVVTPYRRLAHLSLLPLTLPPDEDGTTLIDPRRHDPPWLGISQLPTRKIRAGCKRISKFPQPRKHKFKYARTALYLSPFARKMYIPLYVTSTADVRKKYEISITVFHQIL